MRGSAGLCRLLSGEGEQKHAGYIAAAAANMSLWAGRSFASSGAGKHRRQVGCSISGDEIWRCSARRSPRETEIEITRI